MGLFGIDFGDILDVLNPLGYAADKLGLPTVKGLFGGGDDPKEPKITPPPPAPDLTDEMVRKARLSQRRRLTLGEGIGQTFFTGPLGDTAAPTTSAPKLGAY
jgi:hypothetical protein